MRSSVGKALRATQSVALAFALAGCAHFIESPDASAVCSDETISIFTGFDGAGQHGCALTADGPVLTVWPEAATAGPINPSPWYAFDVERHTMGPATVSLDYGAHSHRYSPWVQTGDSDWSRLPDSAIRLSKDKRIAELTLPDTPTRFRIAGQPIRSPSNVAVWSDDIAAQYGLQQITYGHSLQGRPLSALIAGPANASRLVVLLTAQHPPEYPGARSFELTAEHLLANMPADTRLLLFPLINPDGVANGYWRHSANGTDSNRDWLNAVSPEISSARTLILSEAQGRDVKAFLDFHATHRTLVYTPPFEDNLADMSFPRRLRADLDNALEPDPDWIAGHNANQGTSKNWALTRLSVAGLTIELGDSTSEAEMNLIGETIANTLRTFLSEHP